MNTIRILADNLSEHLKDLIALNDEFLDLIDVRTERSLEEKHRLLALMAAEPATEILLASDENGIPIGISYYNYGSGYSCGGLYLWLNCIYIRAAHQKKGHGKRLLQAVMDRGQKRGIKLFICARDISNETSNGLFAGSAFDQEDQVIMTRTFQ